MKKILLVIGIVSLGIGFFLHSCVAKETPTPTVLSIVPTPTAVEVTLPPVVTAEIVAVPTIDKQKSLCRKEDLKKLPDITTTDQKSDQDGDGLSYLEETRYGTNPVSVDTECDNVWDGEEVRIGTDPLDFNTDGDNFFDWVEITFGPEMGEDPLVFTPDEDNDFAPSAFEPLIGTDPNDPDFDNDGVLDAYDYHYADPFNPNTDGDTADDGFEFRLRKCGFPVHLMYADPDTDGEGLADVVEAVVNYNMLKADSNDDGISDFEEFKESITISICMGLSN